MALSKERTLAVARRLGLATPRSLLVSSRPTSRRPSPRSGCRACSSHHSWRPLGIGGERLSPEIVADGATSGASGQRWRARTPRARAGTRPGERETIKLFRDNGHVLARVAIVVDRTWPPLGGSSVMRRTTSPPDTLELAERLVAEIGVDGYSEVEFRRVARRRPPDGDQPTPVAIARGRGARGVDFPRMQLEWARGGKIPAPRTRRSACASAGWVVIGAWLSARSGLAAARDRT